MYKELFLRIFLLCPFVDFLPLLNSLCRLLTDPLWKVFFFGLLVNETLSFFWSVGRDDRGGAGGPSVWICHLRPSPTKLGHPRCQVQVSSWLDSWTSLEAGVICKASPTFACQRWLAATHLWWNTAKLILFVSLSDSPKGLRLPQSSETPRKWGWCVSAFIQQPHLTCHLVYQTAPHGGGLPLTFPLLFWPRVHHLRHSLVRYVRVRLHLRLSFKKKIIILV